MQLRSEGGGSNLVKDVPFGEIVKNKDEGISATKNTNGSSSIVDQILGICRDNEPCHYPFTQTDTWHYRRRTQKPESGFVPRKVGGGGRRCTAVHGGECKKVRLRG